MAESNRTVICMTSVGGSWCGIPDEEAGVFTLAEHYVVSFLELRVTLTPESFMGIDKLVLSMRYRVTPVHGVDWTAAERHGHFDRWFLEVRDDLRTEYEVSGGASGFGVPDSRSFATDLDFEPEVPSSANRIEVRFMDSRRPDQPAHTIVADLTSLRPLRAS